jgi:[histone H3]-lysine36 N-trimethyltransferase
VITDVVVRDAGRKGLGVFALRAFPKGEFIFRRRHDRIVANARVRSLSREDRQHLCELDYTRSAVLLPPGSYLNHSCEPNAMRSGVKVFAWRRIRAGEEITIDYRLNAFGGRRWKCSCGSASCTGEIVGDFFSLPPATQRDYLPFAPRFIRLEYRRRSAN